MASFFQIAAEDAVAKAGAISSDKSKAVRQLLPLGTMATLFENVIDATYSGDKRKFNPAFLARVPDRLDDFKIWASSKVPDFDLSGARANDERQIYTPNETLFGLESLIGNPAPYMGIVMGMSIVSDLGESLQGRAKMGSLLDDRASDINRQALSTDGRLLLPLALPVYARGKNMPLSAVAPSEPLWWFFRAGGFRKIVRDDPNDPEDKGELSKCPAGAHVVGLMSMPLYANTQRQAPALSHLITLVEDMIARDPAWQRAAACVTHSLTELFKGCVATLPHTYPQERIRAVIEAAAARPSLVKDADLRAALMPGL